MSNERLGKVKFLSLNKTVYFYKAHNNDNNSCSSVIDEIYMSCKAEKLGKPGGQGTAYKVSGGPFQVPIVIKIYKDAILNENGSAIASYLRGLISFRNNADPELKKDIDNDTIWPKMLIYDYENDRVIGFAMNLIPYAYYSKMTTVYGEEKTKESNLDFILQGDKFRRVNRLPVISNIGRVKIIYDFIRIVQVLHNNNYVLGDLSPRNTLVYIDSKDQNKNKVLLIDTDSYRKQGSTHPLKQGHTPNWVPPECEKAKTELNKLMEISPNANPHKVERLKAEKFIQNQRTDVWKLCMAILRLYHYEENSASIIKSQYAENKICKEIGDDFCELVNLGLSEIPDERPAAAELYEHLKKCLLSKR